MLQLSDRAPDFTLPDENGVPFTLTAQRGHSILLVFYPGDNTPVCTRQLCEYRDEAEAFTGLGVRVVGISNDGSASHQKFKAKHRLPFTLLTDPDLLVAAKFDSKGMFGMKRSIFLIDADGRIRYLHIEKLALFRRTSEELIRAISALGNRA